MASARSKVALLTSQRRCCKKNAWPPRSTPRSATLPERQRAALTLVHFQGFGNIEAAEVLDVGVEALESSLSRGRRALREKLAEHAPGNTAVKAAPSPP